LRNIAFQTGRSTAHHLTMFARAASFAAVMLLVGGADAWAGERCVAIDGATLRCGSERVRIDGLTAPEVDDPSAELARQRLQRRIQSGEVVIQRGGKDRYGRTHGRLFVNGNRITQADLSPGSGGRRRN
jgi:endonuclease YncB( thermonuclease family)